MGSWRIKLTLFQASDTLQVEISFEFYENLSSRQRKLSDSKTYNITMDKELFFLEKSYFPRGQMQIQLGLSCKLSSNQYCLHSSLQVYHYLGGVASREPCVYAQSTIFLTEGWLQAIGLCSSDVRVEGG